MEDLGKVAEAAMVVGESDKVFVDLNDGRKVEIYRCKTKQVGLVLRFIANVFETLGVAKLGDLPEIDINNPVSLLQLIAKSSDEVFAVAVELCSLTTVAELEELDVDDSLRIITKEFEVNKSFFLTRVLPMVNLPW